MIVSHQWLIDYLGDKTPNPQHIEDLFTFHAFEVEGIESVGNDTAIDVKVLPNRGSDCLSHRGLARELATIMGISMTHDPLAVLPELPVTQDLSVSIADTDACPRFTAALITGVTIGDSPTWLKDRLATLGQRSINNIVDATNYVMYAMGQPLHAYDADLFSKSNGQWQFGVRFGRPGETVALLGEGGKERERIITCLGTELLIVDQSRDLPIGLAGVKGGSYAGVHAGTKNIIIEAAHFDPVITRKTARRLGIVIDASKRFENRPSPALPLYAQRDIIDLIRTIAGGKLEGVIDVYPKPYTPPSVQLSIQAVNERTGFSLAQKDVSEILTRAGITVVADGPETLLCTGPIERTDLCIPEDFIEEVARIYGFDAVTAIAPLKVSLKEFNTRHYYAEQIREQLLALGFSEVITSSFRAEDEIQLQNALAEDKSYLRSSLKRNLAEVLDRNANFTDVLGTNDTRVFEIGNVFGRSIGDTGILERTMVAFGVRVRTTGYSGKEDPLLKTAIAALEGVLGVPLKSEIEAGIVEFDLGAVLLSLPAPVSYDPVSVGVEVVYQPFSVYPSISRDVALWVDEATTRDRVLSIINQAAGPLRVRTTFRDEFKKDGRTSFAFRVVFQAFDRTLTDAEVEGPTQAIYTALTKQGWDIR